MSASTGGSFMLNHPCEETEEEEEVFEEEIQTADSQVGGPQGLHDDDDGSPASRPLRYAASH